VSDKQLKRKIAELNREIDRLRAENIAMREANGIVAAMRDLKPLASRAFRTFERATYSGDLLPDDAPIDRDDGSDAAPLPSIVLRLNVAGYEGSEFSAQFSVFEIDPETGEPTDLTDVAFGNPSKNPIEALASLRDALMQEPDESGVRMTVEARAVIDAYDDSDYDGETDDPQEKPN
jgi:hypothetical protein